MGVDPAIPLVVHDNGGPTWRRFASGALPSRCYSSLNVVDDQSAVQGTEHLHGIRDEPSPGLGERSLEALPDRAVLRRLRTCREVELDQERVRFDARCEVGRHDSPSPASVR